MGVRSTHEPRAVATIVRSWTWVSTDLRPYTRSAPAAPGTGRPYRTVHARRVRNMLGGRISRSWLPLRSVLRRPGRALVRQAILTLAWISHRPCRQFDIHLSCMNMQLRFRLGASAPRSRPALSQVEGLALSEGDACRRSRSPQGGPLTNPVRSGLDQRSEP